MGSDGLRRPGRRALLVAAFWTANGVLWAGQSIAASRLDGRDYPGLRVLAVNMAFAWAWALATPLVLWLRRRFRFDRRRMWASLAVHAGASLVLTFAINVVHVGTGILVGRWEASSTSLLDRALYTFVAFFDYNALIYGVIVGLGYAAEYWRDYQRRTLRASQLEAQLARARLDALEMQLHPHFLFNALNTISALVRTGRNAVAVRVVASLGDLLRSALDRSGTPEVPLRQELEFVGRYLEIEQVRFSDRLAVRIEAGPDALDARVPHLLLQPLVENAIRHGVGRRSSPGTIAIRAARDGGRLRIAVEDDGPGLPPGFGRGTLGVGLGNTLERLQQLHGERHGFEARNLEGGGTVVEVWIPYELAPGELDGAGEPDGADPHARG